MSESAFAAGRITVLREGPPQDTSKYVLYWMEHAQRAEANPAMERAIVWANRQKLPLLVLFVVDPGYPEGNARHFTFMLQGLKETMNAVRDRGAHFSLRKGDPPQIACELAENAAVVVTDRGYLRHLKAWRETLAQNAPRRVEMVEGDVIVPVEIASPKMETAARTIRPKLRNTVNDHTTLPPTLTLDHPAKRLGHKDDLEIENVGDFVRSLNCDQSVAPVSGFEGGLKAARSRLERFLRGAFKDYGDGRSDIVDRRVSTLSPYLHLGQISPLEIYHKVRNAKGASENAKAFLEEMVVRRELAVNYVHYCDDYDRFKGLPVWAQKTLAEHKDDERASTFTRSQLEDGKTDDPYWNAAMREMRLTGYLHNHLRMYWGKRILAWKATPEAAYRDALFLNNKYLLDGRDANSYANISWLFGLHDRGWPERDVYGKVRIMMPSGLKRKFDIDAYVRWANAL